ncbi:uncharacterized protein At1g65710-like [Rutidosis leptorrhynchoides]|uniref:uncharacterized protein At1g65710-like n=1 Tax=Rutidosis leptorrhynchoides TaxID=125765 RepID=UPI003A9A0738
MGGCFSKKCTSSTTPIPQQPDFKPDFKSDRPQQQPHALKKEIFVIKHRISHEIDRHSNQDNNDQNPSPKVAGATTGTSSCSKDEVDSTLLQCDRLGRSNSAGAQNPNLRRRRRYSRSKRSFDFDLSNRLKHANEYDNDNVNDYDNDNDEIDGLHHWQREVRVSSPVSRRNSRSSSKERRISISPSRRSQSSFGNSNTVTAAGGGGGGSSSKERRISISPSKRSQSPFRNSNNAVVATGGGGSNNNRPPAKMVSVPATNKSHVAGGDEVAVGSVKRIHVKRNVSPAKTNLRVYSDNQSEELRRDREYYNTREVDEMYYRRRSLVEIDNNAARSSQAKRTRKLSREIDMNVDPSPPSYASLLLDDINKFHQKNASGGTKVSPDFVLPECVSKACSIMEAVADLNSNTGSLCSDERWRNTTPIKKDKLEESRNVVVNDVFVDAIEEPESSGSNGERNLVDSATQGSQLGRFQRDFMEYPRKGIGRGRKSPYLTSNGKTVPLT